MMHSYFVPAVAFVLLSGCATLPSSSATAGQPTTFVVGESPADAAEQKKTTDLPVSEMMMEESPKFLPLRWFFGGHQ
jgi:hypothetical protein